MNPWHTYFQDQPTFHRVRLMTHADPPWVIKGALLASGLILLPTVIFLAMGLVAALILGGGVFLLLRLVARALAFLTGSRRTEATGPAEPLDDGRENVRVIQR